MDNLTIPFVFQVPTSLMDLSLDFEENVIKVPSDREVRIGLAQQSWYIPIHLTLHGRDYLHNYIDNDHLPIHVPLLHPRLWARRHPDPESIRLYLQSTAPASFNTISMIVAYYLLRKFSVICFVARSIRTGHSRCWRIPSIPRRATISIKFSPLFWFVFHLSLHLFRLQGPLRLSSYLCWIWFWHLGTIETKI